MPVTTLGSAISVNDFFNYYDAPSVNKSVNTATSTASAITWPGLGSNNLNIGYYRGAGNYFFYLKVFNTDGVKGTVSITYPWSQSTSVTNGYVGGSRQAWTPTYSYITVTVSVNYGYTFDGWWTTPSGLGTLISSASTINVFFDSTYRDNIWYARYAAGSTTTTTTSTTTTTTSQPLELGYISSTSHPSDGCSLTTTETVYIQGNYARIFNDSAGNFPFIGDGNYYKMIKASAFFEISATVDSSGFVGGSQSLCP
jgi:hypothetical protein